MKRTLALVAIALAGFAVGFSGCGDDGDEAPGTTAATVTTGQSVPTNTGTIDTGTTTARPATTTAGMAAPAATTTTAAPAAASTKRRR